VRLQVCNIHCNSCFTKNQLLVNKNFFHLLFFDLIVKNMRLRTSQNALYFGMKCSKLRRLLGLRPRPHSESVRRSPDPLVGRDFLPSAIAASRLRRLQFPDSHAYMRKTLKFPPPQSPPHRRSTSIFSPPICPTTWNPLKYALPVFLLLICSFPKCGTGSTHNCRKKPSPLSNRTVIGDGVLRPKTASCRETGNSLHAMTAGVAGSVHWIII